MNVVSSSDNDSGLLMSWLTVIGMLTMYWSPVERHVDQCVHLLRARRPGNGTSKKPTKLGSKLKFIAEQMPTEFVSAKVLSDLVSLTKSTVQIRDVFVHGLLNSYSEEQIEIGKVNGTKNGHVIENFVVDRDRLEQSAMALSVLQARWESIALMLVSGASNG